MDIRGKVVFLTGASRGIGAACADTFADRGALLSLVSRSASPREGALSLSADLTHPEERRRAIAATLEHYGRIDILINNAGCGVYGPSLTADPAHVDAMFALNLQAPLALIQLAVPGMVARKTGMVVNVSSLAAEAALPWMSLYSASKAALSNYSGGLRRELRGTGVHVLNVLPVYVTTGFQKAAAGAPPPGVLQKRSRAITARQCAEAIARGVERNAKTVVAPHSGWLAILAQRFAPAMIDSALSNMNR